METKKVLVFIFSLLFIVLFGFTLTWGIINFNKVKNGLSGSGIYNKEDLDNAYNDGYNNALSDKAEYEKLINGYKDTITTLNDTISQLNSEVSVLTKNNEDYKNQVQNLTNIKVENENRIADLTEQISNNNITIENLNNQVKNLKTQVDDLLQSEEDKSKEITRLKEQISNLQALSSQLQLTNQLNVETINSLNNQIKSLNSQISEMTYQISNSGSIINSLNSKISELEKSVAYYEQYIANLENGEQVVATFEFNGSVYNIQIVNKNDIVSVTTPTSTDYVIFNYWTVNGEQVDLSSYPITQNTKFVADITIKYDVKFTVDNEEHDKQIIVKDSFATVPEIPTKDGFEFDGWTLNGVDIIDISSYKITQNTTFVAKFTQLHTVTFMYENEVLSTQSIRNGECANDVEVENTTYKRFNGWKINNSLVDIQSYKITSSIVFIADIIYSYNVNFIVEDNVIFTTIVEENNVVKNFPNNVNVNENETYIWTLDKYTRVNFNTYYITEETNFYCKFINSKSGLWRSTDGTMEIRYYDSGVVLAYWSSYEEVYNLRVASFSTNNPYGDYDFLFSVIGCYEFNVNVISDTELEFIRTVGTTKLTLLKSNETLTQKYIEKVAKGTTSDGVEVEYTFSGYNVKKSGAFFTDSYVIVENKIYYREYDWMSPRLYVYDCELTDSYIKFNDVTYYFIEN